MTPPTAEARRRVADWPGAAATLGTRQAFALWRAGVRHIRPENGRAPTRAVAAVLLAALRESIRYGLGERLRRWPATRGLLWLLERRPAGAVAALSRPPLPHSEGRTGIVLAVQSLRVGGAERQVLVTAEALAAATSEPVALVCAEADAPGFALADQPRVAVPLLPLAAEAEAIPAHLRRLAAPLLSGLTAEAALASRALAWAAYFNRMRPRVVHAWLDAICAEAGLGAVWAGVPRIILSTRNVSPLHFPFYAAALRPVFRWLLARGDVLMINNSAAGAADYARWLGMPSDEIRVIGNALGPGAAAQPTPDAVAALRAQMGLPSGVPVVGGVFRLHPVKRPQLWMACAAEIARARPDVQFLVVGDGPERASMQAAAHRLGIGERVHFTLMLRDIAPALAVMDCFLLTSRHEGMPNVLLEAQAQGVPVVSTDVGGARDTFVDGVTGQLAKDDRPATLAAAVLQILSDQSWRSRAQVEAPRQVMARYGRDAIVAAFQHAYNAGASSECALPRLRPFA